MTSIPETVVGTIDAREIAREIRVKLVVKVLHHRSAMFRSRVGRMVMKLGARISGHDVTIETL